MRLYKITVEKGDQQHPEQRRWAGSEAAAKAEKRALAEAHDLGPRTTSIAIEAVEVPTGKGDLIAFLNEQADEAYAEASRCGSEDE